MVLVPISSTKTNRWASSFSAIIACQAALSHSSRSSAPTLLFSAEAHPLEQPPDGGVAQDLARGALQEASSLRDGSGRALLDVLFEKLLRHLVGFRRPSSAFSRAEGLSPAGDSNVAFNRGETHAEKAGGLGLGGACLDSLDDPGAQIF